MSAWKYTLLAIAIAIVGWASPATTYSPTPGSPLASREHPRIWLSKATVGEINSKIANSMKTDYQDWVRYLEANWESASTDQRYFYHIRNYAFVYAIGAVPGVLYARPLTDYADRAKALMLQAVADGVPQLDGGDHLTISVAVGYDWIHNRLSASERATIVGWLRLVQSDTAVANPFHQSRNQPRNFSIIAGLSYAYDPEDDGSGNQRLNNYSTQIAGDGGSLNAANLYAGDTGGWSSGMQYSVNGQSEGDGMAFLMMLEAWRTANNKTKMETYGGSAATALRYYPQWVSYAILPGPDASGRYYYSKMRHMDAASQPGWGDQYLLIASLRIFKGVDDNVASLAEWLMQNRSGSIPNKGVYGQRAAMMGNFLFGQSGIVPKSPAELKLPLTKEFHPMGWVVMRTGWDRADDTMVTFMAAQWTRMTGAYTDVDSNSFTIHRAGPLALMSGSEVHHWYADSTWAANTIIFPDPNEKNPFLNDEELKEYWDQGGQRGYAPNLVYPRTSFIAGTPWDMGGIERLEKASESDRDYDYVYSDATRAYNGPRVSDGLGNSLKVSLFTRQLVFVRPESPTGRAFVIVFDRTETTESRFEKRWLLHVAGNPTIDVPGTVVREGKWNHPNAKLVTASVTSDGYKGRLFSQTLLPASRRIVKIGGPGHEYEDPYGVNDSRAASLDSVFAGDYRIEVIPSVPSRYDTFLHVLEATDTSVSAPMPATLLSGTGFVGARVANRVVAFAGTETRIETGAVTVDAAGSYNVLLCDLTPGAEYKVTVGGTTSLRFASDAGTVYLESQTLSAGTTIQVQTTGQKKAVTEPPRKPSVALPGAPTNVRIVQ